MTGKDKKSDFQTLVNDILANIGGKENISHATHCATRLRLNLKNRDIVDAEQVKRIEGVIGVVESGGQFQIIIGQSVGKVYDTLCATTGLTNNAQIDENLDSKKVKLTPKAVGSNILNYLSGSVIPLIPIMVSAGLFKTISMLLGPNMLNLINEQSNLYILLDFLYDAGFYFLPIYLGYTAAKKIGTSEVLGMFLGGILIAPDLIALVSQGAQFSILGIPTVINDYSSSVLPILLSVWILSYVEKYVKKYVPETFASIFTPFLTMAIMVPVSLIVLAPIGSIVSKYISSPLLALGDVSGILAVTVIAVLWQFLVMSGMHMVILMAVLTTVYASTGSESVVFPAAACATCATFGMALGLFFRLKEKSEKALSLGYFISGILGGVTEPALYGGGLRYKRPFIGLIIGAAVGGFYAGLTHVSVYVLGPANFLSVINYIGGENSTLNLINGTISSVLSLVVAAIVTYIVGVSAKKTQN